MKDFRKYFCSYSSVPSTPVLRYLSSRAQYCFEVTLPRPLEVPQKFLQYNRLCASHLVTQEFTSFHLRAWEEKVLFTLWELGN